MIMVHQQDPLPAILDINDHSLEKIATILETVDPNELHITPINATIEESKERISMHFIIQK